MEATQFGIILGNAMSVLGFVLALVLFGRVRAQNHPGATMAWLLGMVFVPVIAIPLYLLFGGGRRLRRLAARKAKLDLPAAPLPSPIGHVQEAIFRLPDPPPAAGGNRTRFLGGAESFHTELLAQIRSAGESIDIATFILGDDAISQEIVAALVERAAAGVRVRLLLDGVGSFWTSSSVLDPLREAGGEVSYFLPMFTLRRRISANHRLHRKIIVVDGCRAIVGGHNLSGQYAGPEDGTPRWTDASLLLEGPTVLPLAQLFAQDWAFSTNTEPISCEAPPEAGNATAQVVASGPDITTDPFYDVLLTGMMQARERIWIVTPYFVPDDTILRVLCLMAKLGRDVRIIVPRRSNHRVADLARRFPVRQLIAAGAKVLYYEPRMLHAKLLIIDDTVAAIGSPNMDMRSLYLNYEVALFLYSQEEVRTLAAFAEELQLHATPWHPGMLKTGFLTETMENVARLVSPML
jgi:cardiolipin synthase